MKTSPGKLMFKVWLICITIWVILPFQLTGNGFPIDGLVTFVLFIGAFLLGSAININEKKYQLVSLKWKTIDFSQAEKVLTFFSIFASLLLIIDFRNRDILDLAESYQLRSDQADAILQGSSVSNSSIAFQLAFLTYPAAFVFIAFQVVYKKTINYIKLAFIGFLPIVLATLVMGGRAPIFYAFIIAFFAWRIRTNYSFELGHGMPKRIQWNRRNLVIASLVGIIFCFAVYYFALVFFVRAEVVGGSEGMFIIAEETWGVKFTGTFSNLYFTYLGKDACFLLFIFTWYAIQGFVMSNLLFAGYAGPMQLGTYGIDLASALMRRINGDWLASNFNHLLKLGTYGFLPSAFGCLFVDFKYLGILICFAWGWWCKSVYFKVKVGNLRSMILAPFMLNGIIFSLINTPFGFTNGLVTHLWLFIVYFLIKSKVVNNNFLV